MDFLPEKNSKAKSQSGQALLVILLAMSVILTVVLSLVSRSITDVTITTQDDDALRAITAAEAGVEKAIITGVPDSSPVTETFSNEASYEYVVTQEAQTDKEFDYPVDLFSGETATFWLVTQDENGDLICDATHPCTSGGTIRVCWDRTDDTVQEKDAAVEISLYHDTSRNSLGSSPNFSDVDVERYAIDPQNDSRIGNFSNDPADFDNPCSVDGKQRAFSKLIDLGALGTTLGCSAAQGCFLMVRVKPLATDEPTPIGIVYSGGTGSLPAQGVKISSTGTSGDATRQLEVLRLWPSFPVVFDSSIFSNEAIIK
ncbi:MAG: hypothetical protein PVJ52_02005 [Candidatus Woesebacteria bacterium]|jgi:hypothetical protein